MITGTALLTPVPARACQIPVFRYALERWPAAPYEAFVFHRGALTAAQRGAVEAMTEGRRAPVNLQVREVDLAAAPEKSDKAMWEQAAANGGTAGTVGEPTLPWVVVRSPDEGEKTPLWAGPPERQPATLLDSPARHRVAEQLMEGQSVVWALVSSGDKARDDAAARVLEDELAELQKSLQIPVPDPDAPGPRLLSDLPLKLAFAVVRVSRDDPAEKYFVSLLLGPNAPPAPVVVPIFGRGRALCRLVGDQITPQQVAEAADFLVGQCSCQVKEMNPGFDLLMAADWQSRVDERSPESPAVGVDPVGAANRPREAAGVPGSSRPDPPFVAAASVAPAGPVGHYGDARGAAGGVRPAASGAGRRPLLVAATAVIGAIALVLGGLALRSKRRHPEVP